ncbi:MAG: DNA-binding MarR family transcriptional regulator [Paracoccaceae bacterium]|jgi:DNA-binding MarR family transcriptional regulator
MAWRAADRTEQTLKAQNDDVSEYLLENQVGHLLRRAHQRHTAIFQATIGDQQLTPLQFAALMKLADVGEASQNHLGRLTAMDAATMQGVIKRLIARGVIARRPDPDDRRRLLLTLTDDGVALVDEATARGHCISDETLEPLSPAERQTFLKLLRRLTD